MRHFSIALVVVLLLSSGALLADIPGATLTQVTNLSAPVYPRSLAAAPDGKIWFSEERLTPHAVGFFTAAGNVTQFPVPCDQCNGNGDRLAYIESITVGPDGNAWFPYTYVNGDGSPLNGGMNSFLGRFTPAGQFTSFAVPTVDAFRRFVFATSGHSAITAGPDGNLWFTENSPGKVGKITTAGILTEYPLASTFAAPSIITQGADGNLWFTETAAGKIGRITPAGAIAEFTTPRGPVYNAAPFGITAGSDGNLWYTDYSSGLGSVTPTGVVTRFELEPNANPSNITTGADSKLYFSYTVPAGTSYQGKIAQFDPSSVSASGRVVVLRTASFNTLALQPHYTAGDVRQATGGLAAPIYYSVASPDSTGTIFLDSLWSLALQDPCVPPVTIAPNSTDIVAGGYWVGRFDCYGVGTVQATVSGLPPLWESSTSGGVVHLFTGYFPSLGNYTFTITAIDGRGCSATLTVTVHIVGGIGQKHRGVKH
jgi:streptogramin lyase